MAVGVDEGEGVGAVLGDDLELFSTKKEDADSAPSFFVGIPHPLSLRDIPLKGDMPEPVFAVAQPEPGWLRGSCPSDTSHTPPRR